MSKMDTRNMGTAIDECHFVVLPRFFGLYKMNVCPRTSMRAEPVWLAIFIAISFGSSSFKAVCRIFVFTTSRCSSCLLISFMICVVEPSLPTQTVGFSALSPCFSLRFILEVITLFFPLRLFPLPQQYASVFAADQTRYDHVRLSSLLQANTTVDAWVDKAFTVLTNHAPVLCWQPQLGSHSDSSSDFNVALRQFRFFLNLCLSQTKKRVNAPQGYLSSFIHLGSFPFT